MIKAKGTKAEKPEEEDQEFKVWQKAFQLLAKNSPYRIVIPYGSILAKHFRCKKPIDMRFFDLFLSLIKASAILHAYQRKRDQKNRLIATLKDYEVAYEIFKQIEKPTTLGVGQNVLDFYEQIILPLSEKQDYMTYEDLTAKYLEIHEEPISRTQLREEYLKPLERLGVVDIEQHPQDRRKRIITARGKISEASLINHEEFLREAKNIVNEGGV